MDSTPSQRLPSYALLALGMAGLLSIGSLIGRAEDALPADPRQAENKTVHGTKAPSGPWRAFGRVTEKDGRPMAGVEVSAHCGAGTLRNTGSTTSEADGRYELKFGPGVSYLGSGTPTQAATIAAHKRGYYEENLNRQGGCLAAEETPGANDLRIWSGRKDRVFLPDRPLELNFVMRPAGRVAGKLIDEQGKPLTGYSVALTGAELPPSSSALAWARVDERGRFSLEDIPTAYRFQFEVRSADPKPPWDDSWASAGLRFERPDGSDLRAWFGDREIRIQEFVLRVVGPGVNGATVTPIAGNAGVLDLTAGDSSAVLERSDRLLVAKSAILTLRNAPRQDLSQSLIGESVSVASAHESKIRLARTRQNEAGEFMITFENPRGFELAPGKHQVIFQVFEGTSQKPIRAKVFRQLAISGDGRYRVPVKIAPQWIDDSQVSITFVSIQPDHNAWVKTFLQDGKGKGYSGIWSGDIVLLPAIPFETRGSK